MNRSRIMGHTEVETWVKHRRKHNTDGFRTIRKIEGKTWDRRVGKWDRKIGKMGQNK